MSNILRAAFPLDSQGSPIIVSLSWANRIPSNKEGLSAKFELLVVLKISQQDF